MSGGRGFSERERQGALNFARMARRDGVRRVIYLGGLGEDSVSEHLRSREQTARILAAEGPPLTYFRAAMVVGAESESYRTLLTLERSLDATSCHRRVHAADGQLKASSAAVFGPQGRRPGSGSVRSTCAANVDGGETLSRKAVSDTHKGWPEAAVDQRDLSVDQARRDHVGRVEKAGEHGEDLMA